MNEYLIFRLYAPLASWGGIAVGENRHSDNHPSKSAIIGLLAASVGIKRDDEEKQARMINDYSFGVTVETSGRPMTDYHTIQAGSGWDYEPATRKDELNSKEVNTILSSRDYYMDALYTVIIWSIVDSPIYNLNVLAERLNFPCYTLYLGRKSCPPAIPLEPNVISAETVVDALKKVSFKSDEFINQIKRDDDQIFFWEECSHIGTDAQHGFLRRDVPFSRVRWLFNERKEYQGTI